jgi:hypothetical protein
VSKKRIAAATWILYMLNGSVCIWHGADRIGTASALLAYALMSALLFMFLKELSE